jgi:hypothetical protein
MNPKLLIATLLVSISCVLTAGEADGKKKDDPNKKDWRDDPPIGYDVKEAEERAFWARRKKLVEKQRAEAEAERKAAEAAKAPSKLEESAPPKESKPETPPAK